MASWWTDPGGGGGGGLAAGGAAGQAEVNHYAVLGVNRDADAASIKQAYQREVLRCHPDKQQQHQAGGGENDDDDAAEQKRRFAAVQAAYGTLRDPGSRAEYDAQLARRAQMEVASRITPAEELDLDEMDMDEEEGEEEEEEEGSGGGSGGGSERQAPAAPAADGDEGRRREGRRGGGGIATYPCRCGDLYRLPLRAAREAADKAAAASASRPPPPPPQLLVQCRGCSNHALVRLSRQM